MTRIELWSDGSGTMAGPGGWAYVLRAIDWSGEIVREVEASGSMPETTNNRAELTAVIEGLRSLDRPTMLTVHSDSEYVLNPLRKGWLDGWLENGWRRRSKPKDHDRRPGVQCPMCGQAVHFDGVQDAHAAAGSHGVVCRRHADPVAMRFGVDHKLVRNADLWRLLADAAGRHAVECVHVKGHDKQHRYPLNERCDELAGAARRSLIDAAEKAVA